MLPATGERLALEVVRIDVDDREVLIAAFAGLFGGVRKHDAGVELVDAHAPVIAERQFHEGLPGGVRYSARTKISPPRSTTL
jgi:hypothetical protein